MEFDVTSQVSGNGVFSFALTSQSTNSAFFSSREGAQPPELVIRRYDRLARADQPTDSVRW